MASFDYSDLRVLVVDDNVHMCRLVRAMLNAFGIRQVADAGDGAEALERMEQVQYDILVIDWEMPVLDGADMARLIRNPDHPYCYAPIIMITGHSTYNRAQEALALGINDVLCKPFSPQTLFDRIADNVLNPRAFVRSASYFGPKPRVEPDSHGQSKRDDIEMMSGSSTSKPDTSFNLDEAALF